MNSTVVCTMFEKRYALGLGALTNSLVAAGFAGTLCVGYRGPLPAWLGQCRVESAGRRWRIGDLLLDFVPLDIPEHFTNYKPQFMNRIFDELHPQADKVVYIDPDIVVKSPWSFFESWCSDAVGLCADINAQCPSGHPLRRAWRRYFEPHGLQFSGRMQLYVNGGFVGVPRSQRTLLTQWQHAQELMATAIGGLGVAFPQDRTYLFHMTDQDALNAVLDTTACELSIVGQDGMDFIPGGYLLSHAQGRPKPWDKAFIAEALRGRPPTLPDKWYWQHVSTPIRLYGGGTLQWKRLDLKLGAALGRFVRRT
jgi:hypothetical protein